MEEKWKDVIQSLKFGPIRIVITGQDMFGPDHNVSVATLAFVDSNVDRFLRR